MTENFDAAYEGLFSVLETYGILSPALRERLRRYLKIKQVPKRHVLLEPGEVSRSVSFIAAGLVRAWYPDEDGHQKTTWFMGPGDVMISVYSFFTRKPALEYIETLEDSMLFYISWRQLQNLYTDFPEFNLNGRLLTEKYYILSEERMLLLRSRKPAERYRKFLQHYAPIAQQIPQHMVASFLELTPETVSRVKSRGLRLIRINEDHSLHLKPKDQS